MAPLWAFSFGSGSLLQVRAFGCGLFASIPNAQLKRDYLQLFLNPCDAAPGSAFLPLEVFAGDFSTFRHVVVFISYLCRL
jgi:hypothetical protein